VLVRLFEEHGDLFVVPRPGSTDLAYVVCRPSLAHHVLVENYRAYEKGHGYDRMRLLMGDGVITLNGEGWVRRRRALAQVYARGQVNRRLAGAGRGLPEELAEQWGACADRGELVDVTRDLWRLVCSVIMTLLCGEDYRAVRGTPLGDTFARVADLSQRDIRFVNEFAAPVRAALLRWITWRRESGEAHDDLLQLLLEARDPLTDSPLTEGQVLDECVTFIVAGVETTSTTLGWLWHLLATAPVAEHRVLAEVDAAGDPAGDDPPPLPHTRQALRETMRLYPPVWLYPRVALQDDRLGDFFVPGGAHVFVVSYLVHRHPDFWAEPDRFLPDRFAGADPVSPAFLPFGLGPRRCAGEDYSYSIALMIIRAVAAKLVLRPSGDPPPVLAPEINLRPAQHLRLRPVRRGSRAETPSA
jgi:cytochrome P450